MTVRSAGSRAVRWGLIGAVAGVAWLALLLELHAIAAPSADANPASAWMAGLVFGLFLVAPITGGAGFVCGLITEGIDARRAMRLCALGAMIAAVLTLAWAGVTRKKLASVFAPPVWSFPGREPTAVDAMLFTAQRALPVPAGIGAIAGALAARARSGVRRDKITSS